MKTDYEVVSRLGLTISVRLLEGMEMKLERAQVVCSPLSSTFMEG